MADKRELLLVIRGRDQGAKKVLDDVGDAADDAKDELDDMNHGLKKLDGQIADSTKKIAGLRQEIARSGDLGLIKDLEKAQRELKKFERQRKLLVDDEDGRESAEQFSIGFAQRIGPLLAKAPISPPLIGAVAAAAPLVSSVVSGAVTAGVALAGVGAGLKLAFTDPRVQAASDVLKAQIGDDLKEAAKPFAPEVIEAMDTIRDTWRKEVRPEIEGLFKDSSRYVDPLTESVAGFTREAVPGLRDANREAEPLIDTLGEHGPKAGKAFSDTLRRLADDSENTAAAVDGALTLMEGSLASFGLALQGLNKIGPVSGLGPLMWLGELDDPKLIPGATWVDPVRELGNVFAETGDKAGVAGAKVRDFFEIVREGTDRNLDARQAVRDFEQAIDDATATIEENGRTLDVNTQKGRENEAALDAIRREAYDAAAAVIEMGGSQEEANGILARGRQAFINAAVAAGMERKAAVDLAASLFKLPNVNRTINYNDKPARDAIARVIRAGGKVKDIVRGIYYTPKGLHVPGGTQVKADGGRVYGPGTGTSDDVPLLASRGEYVIREAAARSIGYDNLDRLNRADRIGSARRWMAGAGASGGGAQVQVRITMAPGVDGDLARAIHKAIRVEVAGPGSGSVQRAYGR